MTAGLPLMKNLLTRLAERFSIPLGLTALASATNAGIQKKNFGSGTTALIISNEEMEHFVKIVNSLEELGLMIKIKEQNKKVDFLQCY